MVDSLRLAPSTWDSSVLFHFYLVPSNAPLSGCTTVVYHPLKDAWVAVKFEQLGRDFSASCAPVFVWIYFQLFRVNAKEHNC